jgi:hypothetical protein
MISHRIASHRISYTIDSPRDHFWELLPHPKAIEEDDGSGNEWHDSIAVRTGREGDCDLRILYSSTATCGGSASCEAKLLSVVSSFAVRSLFHTHSLDLDSERCTEALHWHAHPQSLGSHNAEILVVTGGAPYVTLLR